MKIRNEVGTLQQLLLIKGRKLNVYYALH